MIERARVLEQALAEPMPGLRPRTAAMDALILVVSTSPRFSLEGAAAAVGTAMATRAAPAKPLQS